jgi:hypothetical protein
MNYSQANQDIFALECLDYKRDGFFLDLGCNDPINISNTYLLEKEYGWKGIAIDVDRELVDRFPAIRSCYSFCEDCTKIDYKSLLDDFGVSHVDYLSLDLEPASVTLKCLEILPFASKTFGVITFEHDIYRFGPEIRDISRKLFESQGYHLLCKDVKNLGNPYEDWYVNPNFVDLNKVLKYESAGMEHTEIISLGKR